MDRKKKILKLYYENDYNIINIANECKVTKQYVSKIIKGDSRYNDEKQQRKIETQNRKNDYKNKKMKQIREIKSQQEAILKQQHIQAIQELSGGHPAISNRAFRKWNASAYRYSEKSKSFILKKDIITGADVPKRIIWK
ncbi:MAG: hypothetical protein IJJ82_03145 [Clostridia bacterium]|nr:hypothetical protein [Clostridia bacterium]